VDDWLLHNVESHCPRLEQIEDAVAVNEQTQDAYEAIDYDMENSGFFPYIRNVTNMTDASTDEVYNYLNYMYWTNQSDIEL
jgi:hypothetical protein